MVASPTGYGKPATRAAAGRQEVLRLNGGGRMAAQYLAYWGPTAAPFGLWRAKRTDGSGGQPVKCLKHPSSCMSYHQSYTHQRHMKDSDGYMIPCRG